MRAACSSVVVLFLTSAAAWGGVSPQPVFFGTGSGDNRAQTYRLGATPSTIIPYAPGVLLSVRVGGGDINRDGIPDLVTGTGAGGGPHVKVFDGVTGGTSMSFFPYTPAFTGGVYVAAGDVDGDGYSDVVTGAGSGAAGGHVKVFSGQSGVETRSFFSYPAAYTGGVRVASGDVNGDGRADIITGTGDGVAGGHVKVFDGLTGSEIRSFLAYPAAFTGGVSVATGDINGDGFADIITGTNTGSGHVKVFDGVSGSEIRSFFAFDAGFQGGINVGGGDYDGDGRDDIIVGMASGLAHVKVFDGVSGMVDLDHMVNFGLSTMIDGVFVAGVSVIPAPGAGVLLACAAAITGVRRRRAMR